jgi:hypothetical protein
MMKVTDTSSVVAYSPSIHYKPGWPWGGIVGGDWLPVALPFGPSGNYSVVSTSVPPPLLNWADITQVAWVVTFSLAIGTAHIYFDGLRFVKPLVVNMTDPGATTRRSIRINKEAIVTYADAVSYANGYLANQMLPQIYWTLENVGRVDIPTGKYFLYGTLPLLLREVDYTLTKDAGWKMTATAWEKT